MVPVAINILAACLATGMLASVLCLVLLVLRTTWGAVTTYRLRCGPGEEFWSRRLCEIEAECFYRNIPARLDKWQQERNSQ